MGNEASTPQNPQDEGLQPPSQIPPPGDMLQEPTSNGARPSLKTIFQRGSQKGDDGHDSARVLSENGKFAANYSNNAAPQHDPRLLNNQDSTTIATGDVNKPTLPIIGVMYATEAAGSSARNAGSSFRNSGKVVREGGRKVINSLKNLSIGGQRPGTNKKGPQKDESEWETRWDEDESDDDDGDDDDDVKIGPVGAHLRPAMDGGHSSSSPQRVDPLLASAILVDTVLPASPPRTHAIVPVVGEVNSLDWDTDTVLNIIPIPDPIHEGPSIEMFLPLLRVLGKGSFGKVVLCQKRVGKERGALFAMKILRKQHLVKRRQIERTRTERKVLSVVDHPFIMKLHYAFQTEDKLYLVLDYCPGGELFFHLSRFRRFPERVARFYAAELLLAIGHLHKRGIIYRDLKPENVLLDADGHVKLGDFGLAKAGIRHPCEGAVSMCGTPEYMAPEVLNQSGHGFCVDYWGLGMLIYEMMTGLPPWYTTDRAKLFRRLKGAALDIPTYFSSHSSSCVTQLLERDPRRRLGVSGIRTSMEHEFFRSINWRALYARRVEAPIRPCEGWEAPEGEMSDGLVVNQCLGGSTTNVAKQMGDKDLDAATANFDNTFTRMPVDTEDASADATSDETAMEELHENTFVGFTFDEEDKDSEGTNGTRPRTQATHSTTESTPPRPPPIT